MGKLKQVSKAVASSSPSTLKVTGIDSDSVYLLVVRNLIPSSDDTIAWRVTKGGTIQTDSEYDVTREDMPTAASFQSNSAANQTSVTNATIESTRNGFQAIFHLYNFNSSSEYSMGTFETTSLVSTPQFFGGNGGFNHTVASASDGISFFFTGGATFADDGQIVLYEVEGS